MTPKMTFGDLSGSRDNNFDFLRFLFAALVIFSHSYAFVNGSSYDAYDPLCRLTRGQCAFGGLAVDCFFLISGFLITKSWQSSRGLGDYTRKRALRIMPALVVTLLFCAFVVGPLATVNRSGYFQNSATYKYLGFMLTKSLHVHDRLPGVFVHNPWPYRVNGSLWTIRVEILCYTIVAAFGMIGLYRRAFFLSLLTLVAWGVALAQSRHEPANGGEGVFHVALYFLFGMAFYLNRDRIPYSLCLLLAALAGLVISDLMGILAITQPLLAAYVLYYVAFSAQINLHHFGKNGDFSYGLYLYAFPIQQLLMVYFGRYFTPLTLALTALAATLALAVASWHLIERPFLNLKRRRGLAFPTPAVALVSISAGAGAP